MNNDITNLEIPTYQVGNDMVCRKNDVSNVVNALMQENSKLLDLLERATKELLPLRELKPKLEEEYKEKINKRKEQLDNQYNKKKDKLIEDYKNRASKFNEAIDENKKYRQYYGKLIDPLELLFKLYKDGKVKKYDRLENFSNIKVKGGGKGLQYAILLWKKIFKDVGIYRTIGQYSIAYMEYKDAEGILDNLKIESEEEHFIKKFL